MSVTGVDVERSPTSRTQFSYPLMEACDFLFILLVSVFNFPFLSASSFCKRTLHSLNSARSSGYSPSFVFINGSISGTFDSSLMILMKMIAVSVRHILGLALKIRPNTSQWLLTTKMFQGTPLEISRGIRWCNKNFFGKNFCRKFDRK